MVVAEPNTGAVPSGQIVYTRQSRLLVKVGSAACHVLSGQGVVMASQRTMPDAGMGRTRKCVGWHSVADALSTEKLPSASTACICCTYDSCVKYVVSRMLPDCTVIDTIEAGGSPLATIEALAALWNAALSWGVPARVEKSAANHVLRANDWLHWRLEVAVGATTSYVPMSHTRVVGQTRSVVGVGAASWYCVEVHDVMLLQTVSDVGVATTEANWNVLVHVVSARQERSVVGVAGSV